MEKTVKVKGIDAVKYNTLMKKKSVRLDNEGLLEDDAFCIASAKFNDGFEAEVMVCTDSESVWAEVWWRDENGTVVEQSSPFELLEGWFDCGNHSIVLESEPYEFERHYWQASRDLIHAWATR